MVLDRNVFCCDEMCKTVNSKNTLLERICEDALDYEEYKCNIICLKWKVLYIPDLLLSLVRERASICFRE